MQKSRIYRLRPPDPDPLAETPLVPEERLTEPTYDDDRSGDEDADAELRRFVVDQRLRRSGRDGSGG